MELPPGMLCPGTARDEWHEHLWYEYNSDLLAHTPCMCWYGWCYILSQTLFQSTHSLPYRGLQFNLLHLKRFNLGKLRSWKEVIWKTTTENVTSRGPSPTSNSQLHLSPQFVTRVWPQLNSINPITLHLCIWLFVLQCTPIYYKE